MSDTILLLGPIIFQDFEVPERINFGGAQRLAVHQFPGGARVIDALGRDDADISFNGTFTGEDATLRARTLDELRALGMVLPLTWDVFTYSVVIREFTAQYERPGWIPFRITCTVLRDEAAALIEAPLALAGSMLGDFSAATALTAGLGLAAIGAALSASNTAIAAPGATQRGTATYTATVTHVATARDAIAAAIRTVEIDFDVDTVTTTTRLNHSVAALESLSALAAARAYTGRAAANLANAST